MICYSQNVAKTRRIIVTVKKQSVASIICVHVMRGKFDSSENNWTHYVSSMNFDAIMCGINVHVIASILKKKTTNTCNVEQSMENRTMD